MLKFHIFHVKCMCQSRSQPMFVRHSGLRAFAEMFPVPRCGDERLCIVVALNVQGHQLVSRTVSRHGCWYKISSCGVKFEKKTLYFSLECKKK